MKPFRTLSPFLGLVAAVALALTPLSRATAGTSDIPPVLRLVRNIELDDYFDAFKFAGLPFPPRSHTLLVMEPYAGRRGSVQLVDRGEDWDRSRDQSIELSDTINLALGAPADGSFRLLLLDPALREFIQADAAAAPRARAKLRRTHANSFGVGDDPQGMSIDPASGRTFVLDATGQRIVVIDKGVFDSSIADVSQLDLPAGLTGLRGLAFNPEDGNLHVLSPIARELYELDATGQLLAVRAVPALGPLDPLGPFDPIAMMFAPSTDLTDEPSRMHLFLAAVGDGTANGSVTEWSLSALAGTVPPATGNR